jgi:hypothetical protein
MNIFRLGISILLAGLLVSCSGKVNTGSKLEVVSLLSEPVSVVAFYGFGYSGLYNDPAKANGMKMPGWQGYKVKCSVSTGYPLVFLGEPRLEFLTMDNRKVLVPLEWEGAKPNGEAFGTFTVRLLSEEAGAISWSIPGSEE